jgi:hypothetical protein
MKESVEREQPPSPASTESHPKGQAQILSNKMPEWPQFVKGCNSMQTMGNLKMQTRQEQ